MRRIRITKLPKAGKGIETGTQVGFALHTGTRFGGPAMGESTGVGNTLSAVDPSEANIEAEQGETAVGDFDQDGMLEHFRIGGKKHSKGGTPLNVPKGTFIFSNSKKLKIGGEVLEEFGKGKSKKMFTPAQLAKQYELNKYGVTLKDEYGDVYDRDTAELMLQNNQEKLGQLAILQEGMKGFPQGIPGIAMPLLQPEGYAGAAPEMAMGGFGEDPIKTIVRNNNTVSDNVHRSDLINFLIGSGNRMPVQTKQGRALLANMGSDAQNILDDISIFNTSDGNSSLKGVDRVRAYYSSKGGNPSTLAVKQALRGLNEGSFYTDSPDQDIQELHASRKFEFGAETEEDPLKPYRKSKTKKGSISPTGRNSTYQLDQDHIDAWEAVLPGYSKHDNKMAQLMSYRYKMAQPGGMDDVREMWLKYGLTDAGLKNPALSRLSIKDPKTGQYTGKFDPATLNEDVLDQLEAAYADGFYGARQLSPGESNKIGHLVPRPTGMNLAPPQDNPFEKIGHLVPPMTGMDLAPQQNTFLQPEAITRNGRTVSRNPKDPTFITRGKEKMPWWTQDAINFGQSVINRFDTMKAMPTYVTAPVVLPNATFADPTRQLAANQEQAAQQNMINALYSGPQRFRSVGSNIQGQAGAMAANILGQNQQQNVGIANSFEGIRADILNNKAVRDAVARKMYNDEVAVGNQQYHNSVVQGREGMRAQLVNGMSNAQRTSWMNSMNPQYKVDPTTGRINFTKGKSLSSAGSSGTGYGPDIDVYDSYLKQAKGRGYSEEKAHQFAERMTFSNRSKVTAGTQGDAQVSSTGYGYNPQSIAELLRYLPAFGQ
jgi:hypothetical protein